MITRIRLLVVVIRPAVLLILGMFALVGLAQSGHGNDPILLMRVLVVVVSFLVFSVTVNDIADETIDRVNLPGVTSRPLVVGSGTRRELAVLATVGAGTALAGAALLTWPAFFVTAGGLLISAAYSVGPVRLANRGAVASLVLPACYVAVPFLVGSFSTQTTIGWRQLELLAGLYLGFVGRIVLKDFRDVKGDALFGKRTFLVRHGRGPTVTYSAAFVTTGSVIVAADGRSWAWTFLYLALLGPSLVVLRALGRSADHRRDERLISAFAILGRGIVTVLLMHLELRAVGSYPVLPSLLVAVCFVVVILGQAQSMIRFGPRMTQRIPPEMVEAPPLGNIRARDSDVDVALKVSAH
jgi:4-hydroxybenzoate polyprenyltransferase